ncbi:MAG: hypothetical protein AAGJ35_06165 [Myxococcota bacterium]
MIRNIQSHAFQSIRFWSRLLGCVMFLLWISVHGSGCVPDDARAVMILGSTFCDNETPSDDLNTPPRVAAYIDVEYQERNGANLVTKAAFPPLLLEQLRFRSNLFSNFNRGVGQTLETNTVILDNIRIFFDYPPNFSLPLSAELFPSSAPKNWSIYLRIQPTLVKDLTAGQNNAEVLNIPPSVIFGFPLIDNNLSRILVNAQELNSGTKSFTMFANIQATGRTIHGSTIVTNTFRLPIHVCKGCTTCVIDTQSETPSRCLGINGLCTRAQNP